MQRDRIRFCSALIDRVVDGGRLLLGFRFVSATYWVAAVVVILSSFFHTTLRLFFLLELEPRSSRFALGHFYLRAMLLPSRKIQGGALLRCDKLIHACGDLSSFSGGRPGTKQRLYTHRSLNKLCTITHCRFHFLSVRTCTYKTCAHNSTVPS
jgi:hypothetical protein